MRIIKPYTHFMRASVIGIHMYPNCLPSIANKTPGFAVHHPSSLRICPREIGWVTGFMNPKWWNASL